MNLFGRPRPLDIGDTTYEGVSGAGARADHRHGMSPALLALLARIGVSSASTSTSTTTLIGGSSIEKVYTTTVTGAIFQLPDVTVATIDVLTLTLNATLLFPTPVKGGRFSLVVVQDNAGSRTVMWDTTVVWAGNGTVPTLTTTPSGRDIFEFICDDGQTWLTEVPASGGAGIIGAAAYKDTRTNWNPNTASIIVPSTLDYSQGTASGITYDSGSQSLKVITAGWYQPWASCAVGGAGSGTTVGTLEVVCGGNGGNGIVTVPINSAYSSNKCFLYTLGEPYFYTAGNTFRADVYADGATPVVSVNAHVGLIALTGP